MRRRERAETTAHSSECVSGGPGSSSRESSPACTPRRRTAHARDAARGALGASTQGEGGELGVIDCFDTATDRDY